MELVVESLTWRFTCRVLTAMQYAFQATRNLRVRLGFAEARGAASHADAAHTRMHAGAGRVPEDGARRFGSRSGFSVGSLRVRRWLPDFGWRGGCWWSGYRGFARRRLQTSVSAELRRIEAARLGWLSGWLRTREGGFDSASGVRETAAPTDARLRGSAWTILPTRMEARRRLGFDCGSAALLNREGDAWRLGFAAACGG
ncbi:hypothetical protein E6C27_scaffold455G00250 [Cucumis melo var. makuwa]|uniref:Uncharacterized protein n=1 Tax=Cucumis melo var. makuwa TaxID=1194695 RepID=A0A5A7V1J6_CUCMM|nr:hypothetical protein E6C27_scaffold455G00250 [Cucumis melo var. makuwa]